MWTFLIPKFVNLVICCIHAHCSDESFNGNMTNDFHETIMDNIIRVIQIAHFNIVKRLHYDTLRGLSLI